MSARLEALAIGRITPRWAAAVATVAAILAWAIYAYSVQMSRGLIVTGMRTIGQGGAAWGIYILFDVYFVGVSFAGISTAALVRLFGLQSLRPISRMAELITIVALMAAGFSVLADLGRPLYGLIYLPQLARPHSPFFGTFTLVVAGYLFASLVFFYLAGRPDAAHCARAPGHLRWLYRLWASGYRGTPAERARHSRVSFWLSLFILPLLVTAHSTLGFVFGIQGGRPGWFSALQAPGFVVLAGVSGVGVIIVVAASVRRWMGLADVIRPEAFQILGNFLWILTLIYLYFMIVEELTASYAASAADTRVAHEVVAGEFAPLFWTTVACFAAATVIGFALFVRGAISVGWMVVAGVLVNIGAVLKRFLIVVPSQAHGALLSYPEGHYVPSWVEVSVVLGLFALAGLAFLVFLKVFPIVPIIETEETVPAAQAPDEASDGPVRVLAFWATLATGLALATTGFVLSLRVGTVYYADPVVPYSPMIFILGVMVTFYSAAVYETIPAGRMRAK